MNIKLVGARPFLLALAGLAATALAGWWFGTLQASAADAPEEPPAVLQHVGAQVRVPEQSALRHTLVVQPAAEQGVEVPFALPATVEADPARLVKVLPPIAGRIASLDKRLGDPVKAGELLFRLDSPDLAQAQSDAQKARAAMTLAKLAIERQRQLGSDEIAATRDIESAQNDFEQASSELARANAKLAQLGALGAAGAAGTSMTDGRLLAVRSPIAGRVVDLSAATGGYWNDPTAPLMTIADLSTVFVTASADEADLASVFVGQNVQVVLDAYPGAPLTGKVKYVDELLDPDTRRVKVRMVFDNRDGRLKPGMFAQATLLAKLHRALLVPLDAVVQSGFNSRVFVEVQPWRFEARVVQLGAKVGDRIEVVSGLKPNERIVVKDGVLLDD